MPITASMRAAMFDQETAEGLLPLLTLRSEELGTPIRVVHNTDDVISNNRTYIAFPFQLTLPSSGENGPPRATLSISNVGKEIVNSIRLARSPITVTIEVVALTDPDSVQIVLPPLDLVNVTADVGVVSGDLRVPLLDDEPYPAGKFTPLEFPGTF